MKRLFLSLAGFVTLFNLMAAPVQSKVLPTDLSQKQSQPEAETFMGTILKDGENYVLSDSATKSRYRLDDAKKAGLHEGKNVKVTGTLDKDSNVIHVETIEEIV
jgi:uncharacterized protein YdeI (BOF family)